MNLGPDFPSRRLSMGDSHQEGSPLSFGTVGVTSEAAQLISSGHSSPDLPP